VSVQASGVRCSCIDVLASSVLLSSLELSDAKVCEPQIRAHIGTKESAMIEQAMQQSKLEFEPFES